VLVVLVEVDATGAGAGAGAGATVCVVAVVPLLVPLPLLVSPPPAQPLSNRVAEIFSNMPDRITIAVLVMLDKLLYIIFAAQCPLGNVG